MENKEIIERFSKLINIKTISPLSASDPLFNEFISTLKSLYAQLFSKGELIVFEYGFYFIYKGKDHKSPSLFLNHFDVVDTSSSWDSEPFSLMEKDGYLYGRGTLDTKGGLFCMLEALNDLSFSNFKPKEDIYFLSTSTEETTSLGADYISKYFFDKGIKFSFVLDEGGMVVFNPLGFTRNYFALVSVGEKYCLDLTFDAHSSGGHSSSPPFNMALLRLFMFSKKIYNSHKFKAKISPTLKETFHCFAKKMDFPYKIIFSNPRLFSPLIKFIFSHYSPLGRSFLKTTVAFTTMKGSNGINVLPDVASLGVNVRVSSHDDVNKILFVLKKYADKYDIEMKSMIPNNRPYISSFKSFEFLKLKEYISKIFPDSIVTPYISPTASDARFFSLISNNVFGFSPFEVDENEIKRIHGDNERISLNNLKNGYNFYKLILKDC